MRGPGASFGRQLLCPTRPISGYLAHAQKDVNLDEWLKNWLKERVALRGSQASRQITSTSAWRFWSRTTATARRSASDKVAGSSTRSAYPPDDSHT